MTGPPGNDDASDAFAAWIFNGGEVHAEIENLAGCSTFPVLDCEREYTDHVIEDFGVIKTHHEPTDEFRACPCGSRTGRSRVPDRIRRVQLALGADRRAAPRPDRLLPHHRWAAAMSPPGNGRAPIPRRIGPLPTPPQLTAK